MAPEKAYGVDLTKDIAPVLEKALATGMSSQAATTGMHNFRPAGPASEDEEVKGLDEIADKRMREMVKIR